MSEFTYFFRGRNMDESPQQMQRTMQKWFHWFKELKANGRLKEPGNPLAAAGAVVAGKRKVVTDGPYAEAKDIIGGYLVVEAADLAQATAIAKGCPILAIGGSVEIRPVQTLGR